MNRFSRTVGVLAFSVVLGVASIVAIVLLQDSAVDSREAQLELRDVRVELQQLQSAPFEAIAATGGSARTARTAIDGGKLRVRAMLDGLMSQSPPADLERVLLPVEANFETLERIFRIGVATNDYGPRADELAGASREQLTVITGLLAGASQEYDSRASRTDLRTKFAAALVILLLLAAFCYFYARSVRASRENRRLAIRNREDALSDALTGLRNRRALIEDLEARIAVATDDRPLLLAVFDLDGFKTYNDSFGHPAGDVLLARVSARFDSAVEGIGTAYRLGGDEFCLLASMSDDSAEELTRTAAAALSESGDAFDVRCSSGTALIPAEASDAASALGLADRRMYAQKATASRAGRESTDVLLQVLLERSALLGTHVQNVTTLAVATARALGLSASEVKQIRVGAELHDIGKSAVPDSILGKVGSLNPEEWQFMQSHTVIGERILLAAPSLAHAAPLVRSSHERIDGAGYPDGLSAEQTPLGAKIICACDAYDAMTSVRAYRGAMPAEAAIAELESCAGSQFDPRVVEALVAVIGNPDAGGAAYAESHAPR